MKYIFLALWQVWLCGETLDPIEGLYDEGLFLIEGDHWDLCADQSSFVLEVETFSVQLLD